MEKWGEEQFNFEKLSIEKAIEYEQKQEQYCLDSADAYDGMPGIYYDDKAVQEHKENAKWHHQLAEWLKELHGYDKPKEGHWEDCSNGWMCSVCEMDSNRAYSYCPNCGSRMVPNYNPIADDALVSKAAVLSIADQLYSKGYSWMYKSLSDLSSVAPGQPVGHWVYNAETDLANCSACGASCERDKYGRIETPYCSLCGARMVGEQNDA